MQITTCRGQGDADEPVSHPMMVAHHLLKWKYPADNRQLTISSWLGSRHTNMTQDVMLGTPFHIHDGDPHLLKWTRNIKMNWEQRFTCHDGGPHLLKWKYPADNRQLSNIFVTWKQTHTWDWCYARNTCICILRWLCEGTWRQRQDGAFRRLL